MSRKVKPVVILVHGTFAAERDEETPRWWQKESDFARHLAREVRVDRFEELCWGGQNAESAREHGAHLLLELMHTIESEERPYHILAHSHGGSVVWTALKMHVSGKVRRSLGLGWKKARHLQYLRGWVTVGTPFLQQRATGMSPSRRVLLIALLGLLFLASLGSLLLGTLILFHALSGLPQFADRIPGMETLRWVAPLWLIPGQIAVLLLGGWISSALMNLAESLRLRKEQGIGRETMRAYGRMWLGLASEEDEAIRALKAIAIQSQDIVPESRPTSIYMGWGSRILGTPYREISTRLFNRWVRPFADQFLWRQLRRAVHGNDRPCCEISDVTPEPMTFLSPIPHLPEAETEILAQRSNESVKELVPELRRLLAHLSTDFLGSIAVGLREIELQGPELVHTSYFDNEFVRDVIAESIRQDMGDSTWTRQRKAVKWLLNFRNYVQLRLFSVSMAVRNLKLAIREFEPLMGARRKAEILNCEMGQIVQTRVFCFKQSEDLFLVLLEGGKQLDLDKLKGVVGRPFEPAKSELVWQQTGYSDAGIPPLGHERSIRIWLDRNLQKKYKRIWANAGAPDAVVELPTALLTLHTGGEWADIRQGGG